jgi:hypothetical protein
MKSVSHYRFGSHILLIATAALLSAGAFSTAFAWGGKSVTGSGRMVEDVRLVSGYNRVELKGAMDVELRQSGKEGVIIFADDNIAPLIRATVNDKTLVMDSNASWSTRLKMRVIIDMISLTGISVSGSGDIRGSNLKSPELEIGISGSGDVAFEGLSTDALKVKISGSGDFRASGSAKSQTFSIAGSGDIRAEGLAGDYVKVRIAGSGDARVWPNDALDAVIMGSGDVRYKGKPANLSKKVLGSGDVSEL